MAWASVKLSLPGLGWVQRPPPPPSGQLSIRTLQWRPQWRPASSPADSPRPTQQGAWPCVLRAALHWLRLRGPRPTAAAGQGGMAGAVFYRKQASRPCKGERSRTQGDSASPQRNSTHRYAHMTWHRFAPSVRSICQGALGPVSHQPLLRCPFDRSTRARVVCCLPLLCEARADLDAPGMRTAGTVRFVIHCGIAFAVCAEQLSLRGTKFR